MAPTVLLDLNGTLTDPRWLAPLGTEDDARRVIDLAVMQAMADTLAGEFRPFATYVDAAAGRLGGDAEAVRALPPAPGAEAALALLRDAGAAVHVLSNSSAPAAEATLEAAGLRGLVDRVLSVEAVGAYKPHPRVYAHAVEEVGAQWLVAAHWWDVGGAKRAGLRTAWVGEDEARLLVTVPEPDVRAPDLLAAARALLEA